MEKKTYLGPNFCVTSFKSEAMLTSAFVNPDVLVLDDDQW